MISNKPAECLDTIVISSRWGAEDGLRTHRHRHAQHERLSSAQKQSNRTYLKKTDKLLKIILFSAVFELMFKQKTPKNVIISEYVRASEFFLEKSQISYLNAVLDKLSKLLRKE